jgi:hypothetical protein
MFNRSCAQNKATKLVCNEKILLYGIIMAIAALKLNIIAVQATPKTHPGGCHGGSNRFLYQ